MPLYEYQCDACGHRFEVIQKFSDPPIDVCPKCGGPVHKLLSSPAIQFKGSGLYITDYAKKDGEQGKDGGESRHEGDARQDASEVEGRERRRSRTRRPASTRSIDKTSSRRRTASRRPRRHRRRADPSQRTPAPSFSSADRQVQVERRFRYSRNLLGEVGPAQREVHHRLQEPQLVAGVVAHALDFAGVDRPRLQQLAQAVGQLNLAGAIALASPRAPGRCRA